MEKETIFRKLRACGGRITAQRKYGKERIEENALADKILARHSFFLKILVEAGVDQQQAEKEASMLEYILSDESFDKLKVYMEKGTWENGK